MRTASLLLLHLLVLLVELLCDKSKNTGTVFSYMAQELSNSGCESEPEPRATPQMPMRSTNNARYCLSAPCDFMTYGFAIPSSLSDACLSQGFFLNFAGGGFSNRFHRFNETQYCKTGNVYCAIIQQGDIINLPTALGDDVAFDFVFAPGIIDADAHHRAFEDIRVIVRIGNIKVLFGRLLVYWN